MCKDSTLFCSLSVDPYVLETFIRPPKTMSESFRSALHMPNPMKRSHFSSPPQAPILFSLPHVSVTFSALQQAPLYNVSVFPTFCCPKSMGRTEDHRQQSEQSTGPSHLVCSLGSPGKPHTKKPVLLRFSFAATRTLGPKNKLGRRGFI